MPNVFDTFVFFFFVVFVDFNVFSDNSVILIILVPPSGRDTGQDIKAVWKGIRRYRERRVYQALQHLRPG